MVLLSRVKNRIAIIGGGPAGIFCAINISKIFRNNNYHDYEITIFEKNQLLKTILPTGNGRCNITNSIEDIKVFASNYPRGEKFLYSVFSKFSNTDTIEFLNEIGIKTYVQDDGRVFPVSDSSPDVRNKLLNYLFKDKRIKVKNASINDFNEIKNYDKIVISAGTRNVENLVKSLNHKYIPFKKSLCSLVVKDFIYPKGVSVKALDGDFLFTDKGISGPLVFKISADNAFNDFPYNVSIKLFNSECLLEDAKNNPKKSVGILVSKYIPKSLAKVMVKDFYKNVSEVSKKELTEYSKLNLAVISNSNEKEMVNAGGIDLKYVDNNCKSKIYPNLWFCGEILNIDGYCGGFNLQNCWSTGYIAAKNIADGILSV